MPLSVAVGLPVSLRIWRGFLAFLARVASVGGMVVLVASVVWYAGTNGDYNFASAGGAGWDLLHLGILFAAPGVLLWSIPVGLLLDERRGTLGFVAASFAFILSMFFANSRSM